MDLWIRSQDRKKLINCNDITLRIKDTELTFDEIMNFNINNPKVWECEIVVYFDKNTEIEILGKYNSEKRALEVLDEIQNYIANNCKEYYNKNLDAYISSNVYEMPKE